jgi:transcriptional regulator with XRE-family HTH domain
LLDGIVEGKIITMEALVIWIYEELDKRDWRPADLARKAGLSTGSLSNILKGNRKAGPEVCRAMAEALGEPPEKLFRLAGLLPPLPEPEDGLLNEVTETFQSLSPEKRREVLEYALWQLQRQQREQEEQRRTAGDTATAIGPA